MEPIKFEVAVSVNIDLSQGTKDFIKGLFVGQYTPTVETVKKSIDPVEQKVETTEQPATRAEATEPTIACGTAPVTKNKPADEPEKTISIEEVRTILAAKVNDHREAIKAKLNELGAPSVTKLDKSKYQEMYNFLSNL